MKLLKLHVDKGTLFETGSQHQVKRVPGDLGQLPTFPALLTTNSIKTLA